MKNQSNSLLIVGLVVMALVLLLAGCDSQEGTEDDETVKDEDKDGQMEVSVFFLIEKDAGLNLVEETRKIDSDDSSKHPEEALKALLEGPESEEYLSIIHENTDILNFDVEASIAYPDFSEELTQGPYGSEAEMQMVNSIVQTLVQFKEIDKVQFLIEGEVPEHIAGHIYTGSPLNEKLEPID